jgi:hypothetical protein
MESQSCISGDGLEFHADDDWAYNLLKAIAPVRHDLSLSSSKLPDLPLCPQAPDPLPYRLTVRLAGPPGVRGTASKAGPNAMVTSSPIGPQVQGRQLAPWVTLLCMPCRGGWLTRSIGWTWPCLRSRGDSDVLQHSLLWVDRNQRDAGHGCECRAPAGLPS